MPVSERVVRAYQVRYQLGAPPRDELVGAIDMHAHAKGGEEDDPLTAAQAASRAGMRAILFKSLPPGAAPTRTARGLQDEVDRWAELDVAAMQRVARAGIKLALTYDELSQLLGIDPQRMVDVVRAVGAEHFMLGSDVGLPILPPLVEAYRLLTATLRAYGMTDDELRLVKHDVAAQVLAR